MSLVFRETEITGFINDLCETFAEQALKKKITLTFHHPEEEKLKLWVDPANFDKIIMNILSNAFKFTPENGSVDIYLTTGEDKNMYDSLQHYAEIIIADSGIGIPAEEKKHIFERFYQIHNDLNKSSVGDRHRLTPDSFISGIASRRHSRGRQSGRYIGHTFHHSVAAGM